MSTKQDPAEYEAWYHTPRGAWIGDTESALMMSLLHPVPGAGILDVGCGTGYFSRRFAAEGMQVTGIDPNPAALRFARTQGNDIRYLAANARSMPFPDHTFEYCSAVTSLCFIDEPVRALQEIWRVSRHSVILGLLNRQSLLYLKKQNRGGYQGARWDTAADVMKWANRLNPLPQLNFAYAVFIPGSGTTARVAEKMIPSCLPCGGFLAALLTKPASGS